MSAPKLRGLTGADERQIRNIRRDPRRFGQQVADAWRSPEGALFSMLLLAVASLVQPALVYIVPLVALIVVAFHLSERRHRHLPMRLPAEAGIVDFNDPKPQYKGHNTARGMIFVGNSRDDGNQELWQARSDEVAHELVIGTTGAGKSVLLVGEVANYLAIGAGVIFADAKATPGLLWEVATLAFRVGREDDIAAINYMTGNRTITGANPARTSNTCNPFVAGSADSWIQTLSSLIKEPDGQNAVFGERALAMVSALLYGLHALREAGHCDVGVTTIRDHLPIEAFETLAFDPRIEYRPVARDAMRAYLKSLPGYRSPKDRIKRDKAGAVQVDAEGNPLLEPHGEQVNNQHGFAQMYFTRALSSLTDTYGHIYAGNLPEVDFVDAVRSRRILVVMLPALEKSPAELSNLGKINLAGLKDAISTGLGGWIEGAKADVLDALPSANPLASKIICDEYGYMAVDGFAVVAAQARGLGFSATWAGQDWAGIKRGSEKEAEQIWSNTTLKKFGRLEDAETFNKLKTQVGEAIVGQAGGFSVDADGLSTYRDTGDVRLEKRDRVDFVDLQRQNEGMIHITWRGEVIRANAFGAFPKTLPSLQINRYLRVGERELKLVPDAATPAEDASFGGERRTGGGGPAARPERPTERPPVTGPMTLPPRRPERVMPLEDEGGATPALPRRPMGRPAGRTAAQARDALDPRAATAAPIAPALATPAPTDLQDIEALLQDAEAQRTASALSSVEASATDDDLAELMGLPAWDTPEPGPPRPPEDPAAYDFDTALDAHVPPPVPAAAQPPARTETDAVFDDAETPPGLVDLPDVIDLQTLLGDGTDGAAELESAVRGAVEAYPDPSTVEEIGLMTADDLAAQLEDAMKRLLDGPDTGRGDDDWMDVT